MKPRHAAELLLALLASADAGSLSRTALLARRRGSTSEPTDPAERAKREAWLASHLKDVFELDRDGRLAPQSGLNIPWDYEQTGPRNAKNDCGDGPGSVVADWEKQAENAAKQGALRAGRLGG
mmetsp:Transcript_44366/g.102484  ORF Transcript_44366/g.102484 Transcript_44366/m.102484 type:complete len:123 (+) Transcript_44366:97-465(+)|eukprot:CAMPEP_0171096978 /NCGR_PEP_ID=MMETSP0766_2-20121228/46534_1 /TAXON_ID=439317 /ORGANISM="Gambierdiscus australes, Strain CAWD 149" /LENGTH=122 /DNA_ID=CAMNT_0011556079 /DNA_START=74 /DNA_END=442 /DNA_ORIENTATION=+